MELWEDSFKLLYWRLGFSGGSMFCSFKCLTWRFFCGIIGSSHSSHSSHSFTLGSLLIFLPTPPTSGQVVYTDTLRHSSVSLTPKLHVNAPPPLASSCLFFFLFFFCPLTCLSVCYCIVKYGTQLCENGDLIWSLLLHQGPKQSWQSLDWLDDCVHNWFNFAL